MLCYIVANKHLAKVIANDLSHIYTLTSITDLGNASL